MAKSSTTSTKSIVIPIESAEGLKANLRNVAEEIARVRDHAKEEADSLERIRGMLDLKYLNDLLSVIDQLERRVKEMEAGTAVKRYQEELDLEQARLAKLWDAFKTQEDQINALQSERDEGLAELRKLEKQYKDLGSPNAIKSRMSKLENENRVLDFELNTAANRVATYTKNFQQEQERLAKLYKVYEDVEARLQKALKSPAKKVAAAQPKPKKGFGFKGYTLYSAKRGKGKSARPYYFFAKKTPKKGSPAAKPAGATVKVNKSTGLPFLKTK